MKIFQVYVRRSYFFSLVLLHKQIPHSLPCQLQSGLQALSGLHHFLSTPCQVHPSLIFCSPHQVLQVLILLPCQAFIIFPSTPCQARSGPNPLYLVRFVSYPLHALPGSTGLTLCSPRQAQLISHPPRQSGCSIPSPSSVSFILSPPRVRLCLALTLMSLLWFLFPCPLASFSSFLFCACQDHFIHSSRLPSSPSFVYLQLSLARHFLREDVSNLNPVMIEPSTGFSG
ncbi:hypothetical protein AMECASPLE_007368 [Ameca splendens]|uniref:Uncharacterized protein n=1 Tax=Ameca splendens TaxID=208324 RepID=A0ABV0ZJD1_9TELE